MSRYVIWDKQSDVITPNGKIFKAQEWKEKYPIANLSNVDIVCSGGVFNGAIFGVYQDMVDRYADKCDFSECVTKQDFLDKIEEFQSQQESQTITSDQTRIADALEDLVVLNMPDKEE